MYVAQIRPFDIANGEGIRVSIFVSGCTHRCPGCFNKAYQSFRYGQVWTDEHTAQVIDYLSNPVIAGLTLLGGEPMQNLELIEIIRTVKKSVDKNIWIYSGYTWDQIMDDPGKRELLQQCDVLVDGLFVEKYADLRLRFRGSSNQRIIDIARSFECDQAVDYQMNY